MGRVVVATAAATAVHVVAYVCAPDSSGARSASASMVELVVIEVTDSAPELPPETRVPPLEPQESKAERDPGYLGEGAEPEPDSPTGPSPPPRPGRVWRTQDETPPRSLQDILGNSGVLAALGQADLAATDAFSVPRDGPVPQTTMPATLGASRPPRIRSRETLSESLRYIPVSAAGYGGLRPRRPRRIPAIVTRRPIVLKCEFVSYWVDGRRERSCHRPRGLVEPVRRVVRRHLNEIRFCYEQQLERHPLLEGRAVVRFEIEADGTVVQAHATASMTVGSGRVSVPSFETCLANAFRRWSFPNNLGPLEVTYPFRFLQPERTGTEPVR